MPSASLKITLDQPSYIPGDIVNGTVFFDVSSNMNFYGIKVKLYGYEKSRLTARVHNSHRLATTSIHNNTNSVNITIKEKHELCNAKRIVSPNGFTIDNANTKVNLIQGSYSIPFKFILPENIPFSLKFKQYSSIAYFITATVIKNTSFTNLLKSPTTYTTELIVEGETPHNWQKLANPISITESKSFFFSRNPGRLTLNALIESGGVRRGGQLPIHFTIANGSSKKISSVKILLRQTCTIHAKNGRHSKTKRVQKDVASCKYKFPNKIGANESADGSVNLDIPNHIIPNINSRLFRNEYRIIIECNACGIGAINLNLALDNIYIFPRTPGHNSNSINLNKEEGYQVHILDDIPIPEEFPDIDLSKEEKEFKLESMDNPIFDEIPSIDLNKKENESSPISLEPNYHDINF